MTGTEQFKASDGKRVFYRSMVPPNPRAAVVILHGIGEHSGRYVHVMERLAAESFASFAPDHRGHGKTAELPGYVESFARVEADVVELTDIVAGQLPSVPRFLLGHSLGGLFAVLVLERNQDRFRGAILSAAAVAVPEYVSPVIIGAAGIIARLFPRLPVQTFDYDGVCRDRAVIEATKTDPLFYRGKVRARTGYEMLRGIFRARNDIRSIRLPLLILHGGKDGSVPPSASRFIDENVSSGDKTCTVFPELVHEILNEPEKERVFEVITEWLGARTKDFAL